MHSFQNAARFKQLTKLILDAGYTSLPTYVRIEQLVNGDVGLRAWLRNYGSRSQFMTNAKIFFYRELNKRKSATRRFA